MTADPPAGPDPRMVAAYARLKARLDATALATLPAAYREDAMSLLVSEPGRYYEIDVLADGSIDVEIFVSEGLSEDPSGELDALILRHGAEDPNPDAT